MAAAVVHHKFAREPAFKKLPLQPGAANITVAELRQVLLEQTQELQSAFSPGSHYNDGTWKIVFMDVDKKLDYDADGDVVPAGAKVVVSLAQDKPIVAPAAAQKNVIAKFNLGVPAGLKQSLCEIRSEAGSLKISINETPYTGTAEQLPAPHFLLTPRADGKVEAVPIGPLFAFRPDPKERRALSLEDAEKLMKSRERINGQRPFSKAELKPEGAADKADDADRKKFVTRVGSDDEDDSDSDGAGGKKKRGGKGRASGGGGGDDAGEGEGDGAGGDSPRKGEDWEHDNGVATDDDEEAGFFLPDEVAAAAGPVKAPKPKDGDEEADGEDEEAEVDEATRKLHKLVAKQRKQDKEAGLTFEGEEGESSESDDEEDFVGDNDVDMLLRGRKVKVEADPSPAPAAAGKGKKRPREEDGAAAAAAPAATQQQLPTCPEFRRFAVPPGGLTPEEFAAYIRSQPNCRVEPKLIAKHFSSRIQTAALKAILMDMIRTLSTSTTHGGKMYAELKPEIVASLQAASAAAAAAGAAGGQQ